MAVITPSSLVSEIRGKVGQQFYSRNAHGPFVGQWSIPSNPNTAYQLISREGLALGVSSWRELPDESKEVWYDWAADQINALSISRKVSRVAYNEFVGRFVNRAIISGSPTNPNPYALKPSLLSLAVDSVSLGSLVINYSLPALSVGSVLVISATAPVSAGIRLPSRSAFRVIDTVTTSATSGTVDIYAALVAKYDIDSSMVGQVIHLCAWLIDANDYTKSITQYTRVTVNSDLLSVSPYIVQRTSGYAHASSSVTISFPSTPQAGDLILIICACIGAGDINQIGGFTVFTQRGSPGRASQMQYKIASGSESNSYQWTGGGTINRAYIAYCIRGASSPFTTSNYAGTSSGTASTTALLNTSSQTAPNFSLCIGCFSSGVANSGFSPNDSFTLEDSVSSTEFGGVVLTTYTRSIASSVSVQCTVTFSHSTARTGQLTIIS
jgi:hypothetical protein